MESNCLQNEIIEKLRTNVCEVLFTKRDGTERQMRCTLVEKYLPVQLDVEEYSQAKSRKNNPENIVVFDLDVQGWRTFNVNRVTRITLLLEQVDEQ